jgi:hypothetical protein
MRVDDYKNAIDLAVKDLLTRDSESVARNAGAAMEPGYMGLEYISREVRVSLPGWEASWAPPKEAEEIPLTDKVLIYHYLQGAKDAPLAGELAAYREIPGGAFYFEAFKKRAEIPLMQVFAGKPGLLSKASELLGGKIVKGYGDEAAIFRVFPRIEILLLVYYPDEEFEARGQVLFDRGIGRHLGPEDVSWLGSTLVYRLMGASREVKL